MELDRTAVRRTWIFLGIITLIEGATILIWPGAFLRAFVARAGEATALGWTLAAIVAVGTIVYTARALDITNLLWKIVPFRILGLAIAIPSSILEECFFRLTIMNMLANAHQGPVVQVLGSALSFALVHAVWGVRGGLRSVLSAVLSTGILGALLAIVFLASDRVVLPCVVAHFVINVVLEPWMGYAYALRMGEGSRGEERARYA